MRMIEINNSVLTKCVTVEFYVWIVAGLKGIQNWFLNTHFSELSEKMQMVWPLDWNGQITLRKGRDYQIYQLW